MSDSERLSFPGPFQEHEVVVHERKVPFLRAHTHDGGMLTIVLDNRFGLELSVADAERVVPFLADAIAIGMGYSCHPRDDEDLMPYQPFQRTVNVMGFVSEDADPEAQS